ncbi:MAG: diaminopimelate epimerase [Bacteroidetes bacterium]|nr:diaminopimelate epimerase [Bacteroidota bacterium]
MNFWKYQGAGNDFIMLDQRNDTWIKREDTNKIAHLCHRRFGIGADGLILLQNHPDYDFEMVYFNADGNESTMCGNGGRCIVAFAHHLGIMNHRCHFLAIDGPHQALWRPASETQASWIELQMAPVSAVEQQDDAYVLNTGSPHFVRFLDDISTIDLVAAGRQVRYSPNFAHAGINVNLVMQNADGLSIRTYERGVEDETYACGTGITAAALANSLKQNYTAGAYETTVQAVGGKLSVRFYKNPDETFKDIWLCGPAVRVFSGNL